MSTDEEQVALRIAHAMEWEDLTNHGSGSCVASHGCAGVTQSDLYEYARRLLAWQRERAEPEGRLVLHKEGDQFPAMCPTCKRNYDVPTTAPAPEPTNLGKLMRNHFGMPAAQDGMVTVPREPCVTETADDRVPPRGKPATDLLSEEVIREHLARAERAAEVTLPIELFRDLCYQALAAMRAKGEV